MRSVSVVGTGLTPFGRHTASTTADIAWPAILAALDDAGIRRERIEAAYCGSAYGGMMIGQRSLARIGLTGIPIANVENACSSSATAFAMACRSIASGEHDVALVIGVDKLSQFGGGTIPLVREDWEVSQGMTMPMVYAMRATRYLHDHGLDAARLAQVPVKARRHGALNPYAQFQSAVTAEQVIGARAVADPFTLLHCCPTGDGAAAVILCAEALAGRLGLDGVTVRASELTSGIYRTGYRDMTEPEITVRGAALAYEEAGIGPEDIDVAEMHDAFSIAELIYYEAFGFCARGDAIDLLESGETSLGGRLPVNPSGGLLSKGHPVGATGVAQIVEIVDQLRGRCGKRQVEQARIGLTHATGGGATGFDHGACTIHIFGR